MLIVVNTLVVAVVATVVVGVVEAAAQRLDEMTITAWYS